MKYCPKDYDAEAHAVYIAGLRAMTGEQRLARALELGDFTRALFREGLRRVNPDLPDEEFEDLYRKRLDLCHNRKY